MQLLGIVNGGTSPQVYMHEAFTSVSSATARKIELLLPANNELTDQFGVS